MSQIDSSDTSKTQAELRWYRRGWPWTVFVLLIFVPSLAWIESDRSPFPWDQAWYGQVSMEMHAAMHGSVAQWEDALLNTLPNRSPGMMWLGQFFVPLGNPDNPARGLLLCSLILQICSGLALFWTMVRLFKSHAAAFVSLLLVCSGPLFVGMTHNYFTEPLQGLGIALFLLFLSNVQESTLSRTAVLLGIGLLVGEWGKVSAAVYLVAFAVLFIVLAVSRFSQGHEKFRFERRDVPALSVLLIGCGIFGYWLRSHFTDVMAHASNASSGPAADLYGSRSALLIKIVFWLRQMEASFFHPAILISMAVLLVTSLCIARFGKRPWKWSDSFGLAAAIQIVLALIVFSLNVNEDPRFLFCLFPSLGLLLCWVLCRINSRWVTAFLFLAALGQFTLVYSQAFGRTIGWNGISGYLKPVDTEGRRLGLVSRAIDATCVGDSDEWRVFIVALDLPSFNADTLSFYSSLKNHKPGQRCAYVNLGVGESDAGRAWNNMIDRNPVGVLFLRSELSSLSTSDSLNRTSKTIFQRLNSAPGFMSRQIAAAPDILYFERKDNLKWRIRSAIYRNLSQVNSDGEGRVSWKVHPSQRAGGDPTVLEYMDPVPADAELVGSIRKGDSRCAGIEIVIQSVGQPSQQYVLDITSPVEGKPFSIPLHNKAPENVLVKVQSSDPHDNIDYCWVVVDGVEMRSLLVPKKFQSHGVTK